MQEHNFNEILDFLCSNIKAKSVKQGVRDELYDHLMCNYETNLAIGMDEENAHNEAINALGDKNKLKLRLSQVHSYNPELSMKKAIELLIPACMFSLLFQYLPSGEWYDIIKFLSDILILVAVFCLGKANKKLKLSFVFYGAAFTISALQNAFTVFIENSYPIVFVWVEIFVTILSILSWTYLFLGLSALVKPYLEAYSKKISFGMVITAHILSGLFWIIINLSLIATDKEYLFNSNLIFEDIEVFGVFIIFLLSTAVFAVLVFKRVSECLVGSDHEYKIETSAKRKAVVAVSAVLIAIVPLLATDVYLSTQKAETTPHYIDDTEIAEEEYNRICNNLLLYGVPEKIVYNLPESEIENYSESVPLSEHEALNDKSILFINSYTNEEIKTKIRNNIVAIGLKSGYIRVLSWVEYDKTKGYSDEI